MPLVLALLLPQSGMPAFANDSVADDPVTVRTGEHPGFSRVVFSLPPDSGFSFDQQGAELKLIFTGAGHVPDTAGVGRVHSIEGRTGGATLTMAAGTICHVWRAGNRVIVDIRDAAAPSPPRQSARRPAKVPKPAAQRPAPTQTQALAKAPVPAPAPATGRAAPPPPAKPPAAAASAVPLPVLATQLADAPKPPPPRTPPDQPAAEPLHGDLPPPPPPPPPLAGAASDAEPAVSFAAALLPADADWPNGAVLLPFAADVGAAAYRRGGEGRVVFDTAQPTDLGLLRNDPVYGTSAVSLLPAGTVLHLPLAAGMQLRLSRSADGWRVGITPIQTGGRAIAATVAAGVMTLAAQAPGRIVVVDDPATGGRLLVATQRAPGQGWPVPYASAEFSLLPTWQGIVVDPVSDRVGLSLRKDGFALAADRAPPLALPPLQQGSQDVANSAGMTRRFDFPALPVPILRNRLHQAEQDAAAAPRLARLAPRLLAAQAMMTLGLDVESAALLKVAQADDPTAADNPDIAALGAMAAWLAGRAGPADRDTLDNPRLTGSDEISLWRGLLHGADQDPAGPAAMVAAGWKLVLAYPAPLRRRLLAQMADILARGGQAEALRAMLQAMPDHGLDSARAAVLQAGGDTDGALALLATLSASPDRLVASRARRARTELLLAAHRIDRKAAAAQLEQQMFAWRGGTQDFDLRMRLAALHGQNGNWRAGLAVLRATDPLYPDKHDQILAAERAQVAGLIHGLATDHPAPLDLIAVAEECAGLLAENGSDAKLAPVLADKLMALDLPERAEPVLERILKQTADPAAKAQVGLRLAQLRLDLRGTRAALDTLDATESPDLPAGLVAERTFARARAVAAGGDTAAARHLLASLDLPAALELRARLEEQQHDWAAAEATETLLAAKTLSATGALSAAQQAMLVHLAGLASQAGDMAALHRMQVEDTARIDAGPRADLFRLLTESPVGTVADLPRSETEVKAARGVPAALASLRDH